MLVSSAILLDGKIYTGKRHHRIIANVRTYGLKRGAFKKGCQGFVDEEGNFYTRKAARVHAFNCRQIETIIAKTLTSEDLW